MTHVWTIELDQVGYTHYRTTIAEDRGCRWDLHVYDEESGEVEVLERGEADTYEEALQSAKASRIARADGDA